MVGLRVSLFLLSWCVARQKQIWRWLVFSSLCATTWTTLHGVLTSSSSTRAGLCQSSLRREQPAYCRAYIVNVNTEKDATTTSSVFFVDFEQPVFEGDHFWRRLYVGWRALQNFEPKGNCSEIVHLLSSSGSAIVDFSRERRL